MGERENENKRERRWRSDLRTDPAKNTEEGVEDPRRRSARSGGWRRRQELLELAATAGVGKRDAEG